MRLPHQLLESPFFAFTSASELVKALGAYANPAEIAEIIRLSEKGLPPITSRFVLALMFGFNPGLVWSFEKRPYKHYRIFQIPKGNKTREITAPKIALKIVQKWLSEQLQRSFKPDPHVYGFVKGKTHMDAANSHCNAKWIYSFDIKDFFPSTPAWLVKQCLIDALDFSPKSADLISRLCCLNGGLAQGSPASPVLSNICFSKTDVILSGIAEKYSIRLSRYADDVVFSGIGEVDISALMTDIASVFDKSPWVLAKEKTIFSQLPNRLKVHGFLVHGSKIRLTKGYRNKIRAFNHIVESKESKEILNLNSMLGHLGYEKQVGLFYE